jgi:hypothetical protein
MVKNIKRKDIDAKSKSTKFAFIITLIEAAIVDWAALSTLWAAKQTAKLTSQVPYLELQQDDTVANHTLTLECKPGTVVPIINAGEAPMDGKAEITAIVEGVDENTLQMAYENQGKEMIAIVERCSDGKKFLFANPCTGGMTFQYQSIGAQDGGTSGINFTLSGADCPEPMLVYEPVTAQSQTPA